MYRRAKIIGVIAALAWAVTSCDGEGQICLDASCLTDACTPGSVGCSCLAGSTACVAGECILNICVDCQRGNEGCVCLKNGTCDAGQKCGTDGLCAACIEGQESCPCTARDGTCDAGLECQQDVCVTPPCPAGTDDCPCLTNKQCDDTLYCTDDGLCATCSNDVEGCPCVDKKCEGGLVCDDESENCRKAKDCAGAACVLHQNCDDKSGGDAVCLTACELGWAWDAGSGTCKEAPLANCRSGAAASILADCNTQHRVCVENASGAVCDTCLPSFIVDGEDCRAVLTCTDLGCAVAYKMCTPETTTADASCGACLNGYLTSGNLCLVPPAHCTPDMPGSIVATCIAQNRACIQPEDGPAICGDCLEGYLQNTSGDCMVPHSCDDLGCHDKNRLCMGDLPFQSCGPCVEGLVPSIDDPEICTPPKMCAELTCDAAQFCVEGAVGRNAECVTARCPEAQAWREDLQKCVDCYTNCNATDPGETGRIWPFTLASSDACLCETRTGWYWDDGERAGKPCDADNDGWVRGAARTYLESSDPSIQQNARCALRLIDRFTLLNEYGQRLDIYLCQGNPMFKREDQGYCATFAPLTLYETVRNDDQSELDLDPNVPSYAADNVGRRPLASELNGLTRLCTAGGDYNENGVSDIAEWHGMPIGVMTADQHVMAQFAYWLELNRSWYEGQPGGTYGRYVIQERSRCDTASFPMGYQNDDGTYWRQCVRSRDTSFDPTDGFATPDFGMEFAEWSCDAASGGCPIPPPPTAGSPTPAGPPGHGLCEVTLPPVDAACADPASAFPCLHGSYWRGMSHQSEFKCVVLNAQESSAQPQVAPLDVYGGMYRWNQCHVACPAGDLACAADCENGTCALSSTAAAGGIANPADPHLTCEIVDTPASGAVGFVAVTFVGGSPYSRGCIDEWTPDTVQGALNGVEDPVVAAWRGMCPGWLTDPDAAIGEGNSRDFGALQCGCGDHYGGATCNTGCPTEGLHLDPTYLAVPRVGYWMCGWSHAAGYEGSLPDVGPASGATDGDGAKWVLRGEIPLTPTDGQALCQDGQACATGFVLTAN